MDLTQYLPNSHQLHHDRSHTGLEHQRTTPKRTRPSLQDCGVYEEWRRMRKGDEEVEKMVLTQRKVAQYQQIYEQSQQQPVQKQVCTTFYANTLSPIPLRQKYADLIPPCQSAEYSLEHRILLRIQSKLDDHLIYLKMHRGKKKGEFFKTIRKNLLESFHLIMQLSHLKQILFLDSQLYSISRQKDKDDSYDVLIDLPTATTTSSNSKSIDTTKRRLLFKVKLYEYLKQNNGLKKSKTVPIPLMMLPFQEKILKENKQYNIKKCEYDLLQAQEKKQQKYTLLNVFNKGFDFEKKLKEKIQEKNKKMKEKQIIYESNRFGRSQMLKVIDEVHLIYSAKKVCNIFWSDLIELVSKKLLISDSYVQEILKLILQEEEGLYLRRVQHAKGLIIQVQAKLYPVIRKKISQMDLN